MAIFGTDYTGTGKPTDPYIPLTCDGLIYCLDSVTYEDASTTEQTDITVKITQDINFTLDENYRNFLPSHLGLRVRCNKVYGDPDFISTNGRLPKINGLKNIQTSAPSPSSQRPACVIFFSTTDLAGTTTREINIEIENINFSNIVFDQASYSGSVFRVSATSAPSLNKIVKLDFNNCIFTVLTQASHYIPQLFNFPYYSGTNVTDKITFNYCSIFLQNCYTSQSLSITSNEYSSFNGTYNNCSIQVENLAMYPLSSSGSSAYTFGNMNYCLIFGNVVPIPFNSSYTLLPLTKMNHCVLALTDKKNTTSSIRIRTYNTSSSQGTCSGCVSQDDSSISGNIPISGSPIGLTGLTLSQIKDETELINAGVIP